MFGSRNGKDQWQPWPPAGCFLPWGSLKPSWSSSKWSPLTAQSTWSQPPEGHSGRGTDALIHGAVDGDNTGPKPSR